ncbi:tRNA 2-thiouridine synthesizing protein A [Clostridiales Family XIII bacterium PM5-7]
MTIVDARGLSCPQPVLMAKKALEKESQLDILVDNDTAKENVSRFVQSKGFPFQVIANEAGEYTVKVNG